MSTGLLSGMVAHLIVSAHQAVKNYALGAAAKISSDTPAAY
jgi:hypothetical protein